MDIKQIIYLAISGILVLAILIGGFKYNKIHKELNRLKIQNLEQVDSLTYINRELAKQIANYEQKVITLEEAVDSLQEVKNKIIIKKDQVIVSKSVSEGIVLLQNNLSKWDE